MAQKKSILEQALLQVESLEEAVKANAKGILQSTMKEELNNLLKEEEDEKDPEKEEKDVADAPADNESSISDEPSADESGETEEPEVPGDDTELPAVPDETPEVPEASEGEESDDDTLDMTGASEEEVLKVFKAMKPEDGIVVKKDGDTVQFSDDGNDYIIKLDDEEEPEVPAEPSLDTPEPEGEELSNDDEEEPEGLAEQAEPADEIVYEIELDDEDENESEMAESKNAPFEKKVSGKGVKKLQADEAVSLPTKSVSKTDSKPFKKSAPQKGVKKLQANEEKMATGFEGTPVKGTGNPETKEPGKGGSKTTQAEKFQGTPVKGTGNPETKEPGKGGSKVSQVEDHPGTPVKGEGKPVVKEPKEQVECNECDHEMQADEAARTKWNIHGDKGGADRAGLKGKKLFKAGSGKLDEQTLADQVKILKEQNAEYKKALLLFKDKLNEVAVFNANLAFATRLFTEHSTTKQEKVDILKRFDTVSTITESRNLYSSIKGELETKKPISEAAVEKIASTPSSSSTQEMLSEAKAYENPQFKRMKELMNKIK